MTLGSTSPNPAPEHVLVGVDNSENATRAALWAAREATDRTMTLHLVHALDLRSPAGSVADPIGYANARREHGEKLLDRVAAAVYEQFPRLAVVTELSEVGAAETLVTLSGESELVVTGTRGHGGFAGLLLGSVSLHLVAHSRCPPVVVRGEEPAEPLDEIVLGVGPDEAAAPIRFAFATAAALGASLHAVRAWWPGTLYAAYGSSIGEEAAERRHSDDLTRLLTEARQRFPEVKVSVDVMRGNTVPMLIEAARDSRLLVVGAHRHRGPLSVGAGSVVHGLLSHSPTPVAVVPVGEAQLRTAAQGRTRRPEGRSS